MSSSLLQPWTIEEFLEWERAQPERYEYVNGVIRAMSGGTNDHGDITTNIVVLLQNALRGSPCRAKINSPKVVTPTMSAYPDVVVTCTPQDAKSDVVRDPRVIVEVLSRSTQDFDKGGKWDGYRSIPSLSAYVLVSQDTALVELYSRDGDGWRLTETRGLDAVVGLSDPEVSLPLSAVYEGTSVGR